MRLQPITPALIPEARRLLEEGFPGRPPAFWKLALQRLELYSGNRLADVPIGYLMHVKDAPAGVILTPAKPNLDLTDGAPRRIVNLSSWYVKPEFRWFAGRMLQGVLKLEDAAFTDLTPTEPVQKMLASLGFDLVREGIAVTLLPIAQLQGASDCHVRDIDPEDMAQNGSLLSRLLDEQRNHGCLAAELIADSEALPLAFKCRNYKGFQCAHLIFCEENQIIYRNLGAIAQYLIEKGIYILLIDIPPGQRVPGIARRKRDRKFARGLSFANRTDYLGSELSVFDW